MLYDKLEKNTSIRAEIEKSEFLTPSHELLLRLFTKWGQLGVLIKRATLDSVSDPSTHQFWGFGQVIQIIEHQFPHLQKWA